MIDRKKKKIDSQPRLTFGTAGQPMAASRDRIHATITNANTMIVSPEHDDHAIMRD
jgi:hypothetical protein